MSTRPAAWFALSVCSLNIAFALSSLLFAALNGYSLPLFFDGLIGPLLALSFSVVGAIIASHRSGNPIGWLFLAVGFSQGLVSFANTYAEYALITEPGSLPGGPVMSWLGQLAWFPGLSLMFTFALLLFPDGRLPSPLWRPVAWVSVVPLVLFVLFAASLYRYRGRAFMENPNQFEPGGILGALVSVVFPLVLVCGLASVLSLVVRFRRSQGIERQQLKWFTYAAAVTLGGLVMNEALSLGIAGNLLFLPFIPSIPVAAGIAVLRYGLYEIDILINRTLVYGSLTVLLVAVYFGGVAATQAIFRALTGQEQQSQLAVVVSTLAIAALFNPLRRRIQAFIDRRFYRRRYDAAKTLEVFSAKLRDETDLDALHVELVGVVRETMQPEHVSLWLRSDTASKKGEQKD
jgi:hypothetical protein